MTLPLLAVFEELRALGLPLGLAEYRIALQALARGFPAETPEDLQFLCQTLWAKSLVDREIVAAVLEKLLSEAAAPPRDRAEPISPDPAEEPSPAVPPPARKASQPLPLRAPELPTPAVRLGFARGATAGSVIAESLVRVEGRSLHLHPSLDLKGSLPVSSRQMKRAWRYYRRMQRTGVATEIDVAATVARMARLGAFLGPVLIPRRVNCARVLLLLDEGGSMVPFRRLTRPLCDSALQSGFARVEAAWFHNVPGLLLGCDSTMTQHAPWEEVLAPFRDCGVLVVSDAGAARGRRNAGRIAATVEAIERLRSVTKSIAWLNPTPPDRWPRTSAGEIARRAAVPMFPLTRRGLDAAVEVLRGRVPRSLTAR